MQPRQDPQQGLLRVRVRVNSPHTADAEARRAAKLIHRLSRAQREATRLRVLRFTDPAIAGLLGVELGTVRKWWRLEGVKALRWLLEQRREERSH